MLTEWVAPGGARGEELNHWTHLRLEASWSGCKNLHITQWLKNKKKNQFKENWIWEINRTASYNISAVKVNKKLSKNALTSLEQLDKSEEFLISGKRDMNA